MSKGIIYNLLSRLIFIIGAYAIHIYLSRTLGPEEYGVFGTCIAIITVSYIFLNNGVRQVVSVSSSKFPDSAKYFLKKGIHVQLAISIILGTLVIIFSKNIALFFKDPNLINPLYLSGIIITIQGLMFIYTGVLNGLERFGKENLVLSTYGLLRPVFAILLVWMGLKVTGALGGFLLASIIAILLGFILTWNLGSEKHKDTKLSNILLDSMPIMVIFGSITIIMNFDLLAVKHFIPDGQFAGYYTSAAAISKLSYWFLFSFGSVLLPFVTSSFHKNDIERTKNYVIVIIRASVIIILPVVVLFSYYSSDVIQLVYGSNYQPAVDVLKVLMFGLMALGLISIFSHIMIGIGREKVMIKYALTGIFTAIVLNIILIPQVGMLGGAISTTISASVVALLSYGFIKKELKLKSNITSMVKIAVSVLLILLVAYVTNSYKLPFLIMFIALYFVYFLLLILLQEISSQDILTIKKVMFGSSKKV